LVDGVVGVVGEVGVVGAPGDDEPEPDPHPFARRTAATATPHQDTVRDRLAAGGGPSHLRVVIEVIDALYRRT